MVCPAPTPDPLAAEALRLTARQTALSLATFVVGVLAAGAGFYQYLQSLRRERIKATNDAIAEAARIDVGYSKSLRKPNLKAEANGMENTAETQALYEREARLTLEEQARLNELWDASVAVNNYFAASMALIEAKYLDRKLFFERLDTFTMVAFLIVYPGFKWQCDRKGLGAEVRSFRAAAWLAQGNLRAKGVDNEFTRVDLGLPAYH